MVMNCFHITQLAKETSHAHLPPYKGHTPFIRFPYGLYNTCKGILQDVELPML